MGVALINLITLYLYQSFLITPTQYSHDSELPVTYLNDTLTIFSAFRFRLSYLVFYTSLFHLFVLMILFIARVALHV
jgi:hypothetical protein